GANVLDDSWDDVRRARESDKLLVQLEGEASRLQNLIHRYINQPSDSLLTEILWLHGEVLSTLRNRGAIDPVVSGSADELRTATERFLNGFEKVRTLQETITQSYENDVSTPAKDMADLYGVIEDAIGGRDSALLHALAKARDAYTAGLLAANTFYLRFTPEAANEARNNIAVVEQSIPAMLEHAESDGQHSALVMLGQRAAAFREGFKNLAELYEARTELLKTAIDDNQAAMSALINRLSAQMGLREMKAQASFDHTLANLYRNVAVVAAVFLSLLLLAAALIARSIILPLKEIRSAMHAVVAERDDVP